MTILMTWYRDIGLFAIMATLASCISSAHAEDNTKAPPFIIAAWHDGNNIHVGFKPREQHYLYRQHFEVEGDNLGQAIIPEGQVHQDEFFGFVEIYRSPLVIKAPIIQGNVQGTIPVSIRYQGCAEYGVCYPPVRATMHADYLEHIPNGWVSALYPDDMATLEPVEINSGGADGFAAILTSANPFYMAMAFFLAGLALTFTPCVLPMIPIVAAIVIGQNPTKTRAFSLAGSYVLGMSIAYAALGYLMASFGAGMNIQARMQSPWALSVFALAFTVLGAAMMGAFELRLPSGAGTRINALQEKAKSLGIAGSCIAGFLSTLVVSPCVSAPLAGTLLFISTAGEPATGSLALFYMGLGMGVPVMLAGVFGVKALPRTGAWMSAFKSAIGVMMIVIGASLAARVLDGFALMLLWSSTGIFVAYSMGVFSDTQATLKAKVVQAFGLLPLAWSGAIIIGAAAGNDDPYRPLKPFTSSSNHAQESQALYQGTATSMSQLEEMVEGKTSALVHITAEWCSSCKTMETRYRSNELADLIDSYSFFNVDVTKQGREATALMNAYKTIGPPALLVFTKGEWREDLTIYGEASLNEIKEKLDNI